MKFVGFANGDNSNRFLHLYDPVTEDPIYIWSLDKIKQFVPTDIGVRMELCERCYRSHSLPHQHTFIVPAFFLDKCLSFFCRETRASIVFVGGDGDKPGNTVYQITSHSCGDRVFPPVSPPPPPPSDPTPICTPGSPITSPKIATNRPGSSEQPAKKIPPPLPPRNLPRYAYLRSPPAYVPPKPTEPYWVSRRIHINDDGQKIHLSETPRASRAFQHNDSFINVLPPRRATFDPQIPGFPQKGMSTVRSVHHPPSSNHFGASTLPSILAPPSPLAQNSSQRSSSNVSPILHTKMSSPLSSRVPRQQPPPTSESTKGQSVDSVYYNLASQNQQEVPPPLPPRIVLPALKAELDDITWTYNNAPKRNKTMKEFRSHRNSQDKFYDDSNATVGVIQSSDSVHNEEPICRRSSSGTTNFEGNEDIRKPRSHTVDKFLDLPSSESFTNPAITAATDSNPPVADSTLLGDAHTSLMGSPVRYSKTSTNFGFDFKFNTLTASTDSQPPIPPKMRSSYNMVDNPQYRNFHWVLEDKDKNSDSHSSLNESTDDEILGSSQDQDVHTTSMNHDVVLQSTVSDGLARSSSAESEPPPLSTPNGTFDPSTGEIVEQKVPQSTTKPKRPAPPPPPRRGTSYKLMNMIELTSTAETQSSVCPTKTSSESTNGSLKSSSKPPCQQHAVVNGHNGQVHPQRAIGQFHKTHTRPAPPPPIKPKPKLTQLLQQRPIPQ